MKLIVRVAVLALFLSGVPAWGQLSITFDFETGDDQGWGDPFSADPGNAVMIPIDNVAGSNRMRVVRDGSFQEVARRSFDQMELFHMVMAAAAQNEANAIVSYDWYVDTSAGSFGSFLQVGTYFNSNDGSYGQDFPDSGKDVELDGTQLASGQVFSGTVTETLLEKGFDMPAGDTGYELGLILNGDGSAATVYFDNITISVIPEPSALGLMGLAIPALMLARRRRR